MALLALLVALLASSRAFAHGLPSARLDVDVVSNEEALLTLDAPPGARLKLEAPAGCSLTPVSPVSQRLRCTRGVTGSELELDGLGLDIDVVFARLRTLEGDASGSVVTKQSPRVVVPGQPSRWNVVGRYARLGAEHVLSGLDHVLFIVALFLQAIVATGGSLRRAARRLAKTATGFTIGHSLTLTATTLGWLHFPSIVAEACIAASLVLVALDIGRDSGRDEGESKRAALAGAFGLVHGLGFAGALQETRLPEHAVALGLAAFNVGVEAGQLLLLAACGLAVTALRFSLPKSSALARVVNLGAYAVGGTGAFLFLLRTSTLLHR
ncbi:Membrane protein [Labilithrix luteola]|uniref:Membrane protein n=1 Tax=Labilithrix luteola TaxID=1391654 RepID=A0A0K1Q0H3_9BACT|nr:HupE/UreJ family protein [Labilithrix luteola]AKU99273.1 Membrane protein [Labilithrix luteola]